MKRRTSVAGGIVLATFLHASPAHALSASALQNVLEEVFEDFFELFEEVAGYVEFIVTYYENLPETIAGELTRNARRWVGTAMRSYLPGGFVPELYPANPYTVTIGDNKAYMERRVEDRMSRVQEVTDYASEVTNSMPLNAARVDLLSVLNKAPIGTTGAVQLGNELAAVQAGTLQDISGLLAENVQLQADQAMNEDYAAVTAYSWAKGHYRNTGSWPGVKSWQPDQLSW